MNRRGLDNRFIIDDNLRIYFEKDKIFFQEVAINLLAQS